MIIENMRKRERAWYLTRLIMIIERCSEIMGERERIKIKQGLFIKV